MMDADLEVARRPETVVVIPMIGDGFDPMEREDL